MDHYNKHGKKRKKKRKGGFITYFVIWPAVCYCRSRNKRKKTKKGCSEATLYITYFGNIFVQFIRQIFVLVFLWYGKCAFIKKFTPNNELKDTRNQRKLWESFMRRTAVTSGAHVNSAAWFTCSCQSVCSFLAF